MARSEKGRLLNRQKVLEAALKLIDDEGVEGFNMRKLGAALGVEAMSLYNHIEGKDDVLDGVIELLLLQASYPQRTDVTPRQELWDFAHEYRNVLRAHPRAVSLVAARQLRTDASLAILERLLETLHRAGVEGVDAIYAVNSFAGFIIGHALFDVGSVAVAGFEQEVNEKAVWQRLSPDRYPTLRAAIPVFEHWSAEREFDFGLRALLQSILPQRE
ncbi:TetR/AcrR family transcriptional regulator C-terminal domain-containing protein [Ktedonospora formicarum]|uniref:TetR family transcriptional regulator n=1 Tax=Ktedonospora formicarum TaxID=2778364 RepID=A0A8J3MTH4_9CHLR|nr:TetR/AcrR family transcriptional regulator C-terminal domain-containing protein [Ktedonospora formicarum]GHO48237.1 TetR family transcriptional regulator [Ktedonospora formicarum]